MKRKLDLDSISAYTSIETISESSITTSNSLNPWTLQTYSSKYYDILKKRQQLPVYEFKAELEEKIKSHQTIVVEGETGSGIVVIL